MAVNRLDLAQPLAKKLAKKIRMDVAIHRNRNRDRKYFLVQPAYGMCAPKNSDFIETISYNEVR